LGGRKDGLVRLITLSKVLGPDERVMRWRETGIEEGEDVDGDEGGTEEVGSEDEDDMCGVGVDGEDVAIIGGDVPRLCESCCSEGVDRDASNEDRVSRACEVYARGLEGKVEASMITLGYGTITSTSVVSSSTAVSSSSPPEFT
jgi:hypothetical protein